MYKPLADSTLHSMTKKEIIELLRIAEHNAKASQERVEQQAENLKDWEPVVRCKDCKYAYINSFSAASGVALCSSSAKVMQQDDFCSYGERKDGGADDEV